MGVVLVMAGLLCMVAFVAVTVRRDRRSAPTWPLRGPGVAGWCLVVAALALVAGGVWRLAQPVLALYG